MINFLIILFFIFNSCSENDYFVKKFNNIKNNHNYFNQSFKFNKTYLKKKNVILGIIENYSISTILPFFKSLIKANFENSDIVIFVRRVSSKTINYLKNLGVFIYNIPKQYKNISTINVRWKMYSDFLKDKIKKYNLVLHTDIRDTFFQKDIFKYYENYQQPFLGVAIEDGNLNETMNKQWIVNYIGEEIHKKIRKERIICVGQVWGTIDKFMEFSSILWQELKSNPEAIEQGVCNYLIYYKRILRNYLIKSDNFGPIMTIGLTAENKIHLDYNENILNFNNEIASVIHQYDRKENIVKIVKRKFCPELDIFSNKTEKNIIYLSILFQFLIIILSLKIRFFKYYKIKK